MIIGLNPSTADESGDDNTIKKVKKIAANNGYGGFYMMNLFTKVSTDPDELILDYQVANNDMVLTQRRAECKDVVFAWGNFDIAKERGFEVMKLFPNALALKMNKSGSPKHPLYCPDKSILIPFKYPTE